MRRLRGGLNEKIEGKIGGKIDGLTSTMAGELLSARAALSLARE